MKTLTRFPIFIIAFSGILFTSACKKGGGGNTPGQDGDVVVYLAGKGDGEPAGPSFWKNGEQTNLTAPFGGDAYGIDIAGSTIYVGGRVYTNNGQTHFLPAYWKDGTLKELPLPLANSVGIVKGISVSDGVPFCAGLFSDSIPNMTSNKWFYQPGIWIGNDDEVTRLEVLDKNPISNSGWYGMGEAVATISNGNKIGWCVVGSSQDEEGFSSPCYWAKGFAQAEIPGDEIEANALSHLGYGGSAMAIAATLDPKFGGDISQTSLLMAGYVDDEEGYNIPCYWIEGTRHDLPRLSEFGHGVATAIFSGGGAVLTAGYCISSGQGQVPCVWKGNNRTDLPLPANSSGGRAVSVFEYKDVVYVGGTIMVSGTEFPCYWKNGELVQINKPGIANAMTLDLD